MLLRSVRCPQVSTGTMTGPHHAESAGASGEGPDKTVACPQPSDADAAGGGDAERGRMEAELLYRLADAVNRAETPEEVFEPALDAVTRGLGVDRASILLFDDASGGPMRFRAWRGLSESYRRAVEGYAAWRSDDAAPAPILVADTETDPAMAPLRDVFRTESIRALGFFPLVHQRRLLGNVMVYASEPRQLGEAEVRLARTIGAQIAQAVARSRLIEAERAARAEAEEHADRIRRLQNVTSRLSATLLPGEVVDVVIDEGTRATSADTGAIWIVSRGGTHLEVLRTEGHPGYDPREVYWKLPIDGSTPVGDCVRLGQPIFLTGRSAFHERYPRAEEAMRPLYGGPVTLAVVPLRIENRSLGALAFSYHHVRQLGEVERGFLVALAQHCAQWLERARLFEEAAQARAEAETASRAKDEFISLLGHELRNPLSPILTALELMRLRGPDAFARERGVIERQVGHLVRLVDDLLDVSRITRGKVELRRQCVEVADVVRKAIEMASPLLEQRHHHLMVEMAEGVRLYADEARLAQVVANLLTNAAKYTEPGGRIRLAADRTGGEVTLAVSDNGRGISPELLPRMFDLFVQGHPRGDRSQGGLGLGLAIVRSLVELHGGRVEARSTGPGHGSEFVVRLPVFEPSRAESVAAPAEVASGARPGRPLRILVIDDNRDGADFLAEVLSEMGHEVAVAYDGPSGLATAASFRPELALVDIGLPIMDGYEVARRLRAEPGLEGLTLVAVTGYGQKADRERALRQGFAEHLTKPLDLERLRPFLS